MNHDDAPFVCPPVGRSLASCCSHSRCLMTTSHTGSPIVHLAWGIVDVRDVAKTHVAAITNPKAKGRYVCTSDTLSFLEIVNTVSCNTCSVQIAHSQLTFTPGYIYVSRSVHSQVSLPPSSIQSNPRSDTRSSVV